MLHKLVEFIHVNICKYLRGEIADWHASALEKIRTACFKTLDYLVQEIENFFVFHFLAKNFKKRVVIYGIKKPSHVALKSKAWMRVIFADSTNHAGNFLHALVCSFANSAGIRIVDESRLEYAVQNIEHGMMKHSIPHRSLVDSTKLWVVNPKSSVWSMLVRFIFQISIQVKNILFKIQLKLGNVRLVAFVGLEYLPCTKERLGRNYRPI